MQITSISQFVDIFYASTPGHSAVGTFVDVESDTARSRRMFRHVWDDPAHFPPGSADVYFAPGRFVRRKRDQLSFMGSKAIWTDLDVDETGQSPAKYASQTDALGALRDFCETMVLPRPLIVLSGRGVQAFFVCKDFMDAETWLNLATRMRAAMDQHNVRYDPARATDSASLMRMPFTINSKNGVMATALPFTDPVSMAVLSRALEPFRGSIVPVSAASKKVKMKAVNNFLTFTPYLDATADALKIASLCGQVGFFRESPQKATEPLWYHVIQLLRFCKDGHALAHAWSAPDPRYDPSDLDERLERFADNDIGPTLCEQFKRVNAPGCAGCVYADSVKTPITLGRAIEPAPLTYVQEQYKVPALPKGFSLAASDDNALCYLDPTTGAAEKILDGPLIVQRFLSDVSREAAEYKAVLMYKEPRPDAPMRRFEMGLSLLKAPDQLRAFLAGQNVLPSNIHDPVLAAYLQTCVRELTRTTEASVAYSRAGWGTEGLPYENNFFIQRKMFGATNEIEAVPQTPFRMASKGSWVAWYPVFNHYLIEAPFPYRTAFLAGFAAPLMRFTPTRGVAVALVSELSGIGKSLVQQVASAIWSTPDALVSQKNDTTTALYKKLGALNSLPFSIDEATHMEPHTLKDMVFSISSGHEKARVTRSGDGLQEAGTWRTIALFSSNHSLADKIAEGAVAAGESARLLELKADVYATQSVMRGVGQIVTDNYGRPGEAWGQFIATNQEKIASIISRIHNTLTVAGSFTASERFYKDLFAACVTAALCLPECFSGVVSDPSAYIRMAVNWSRNREWVSKMPMIASSDEDVLAEIQERERETRRQSLTTRAAVYTKLKTLQDRNGVTLRVLDAGEPPIPDAHIIEYRHDGTLLVNKAFADEHKLAPGRLITIRAAKNQVKFYQYGDHALPASASSTIANIVQLRSGQTK